MKKFCFTIDDNIRFLQEINAGGYESLFAHPYLTLLRTLHERYGVKIQANLFYENQAFSLAEMTDFYKKEWENCAGWLKLSFHSRKENVRPYENSAYEEVYRDCSAVRKEILRFAGKASLGKTTTVHYCAATQGGVNALRDCGVIGLLGLFGTEDAPRTSYSRSWEDAGRARNGEIVRRDGVAFSGIDIILNNYSPEEISAFLRKISDRPFVKIMIHEQFFYPDWAYYEADFEKRIAAAIEILQANNFESVFFEEVL